MNHKDKSREQRAKKALYLLLTFILIRTLTTPTEATSESTEQPFSFAMHRTASADKKVSAYNCRFSQRLSVRSLRPARTLFPHLFLPQATPPSPLSAAHSPEKASHRPDMWPKTNRISTQTTSLADSPISSQLRKRGQSNGLCCMSVAGRLFSWSIS